MSRLTQPPNVQFYLSVLYRDRDGWDRVRAIVEGHFNKVELDTGPLPADHFQSYAGEMGPGLANRFVTIDPPGCPDRLPDLKILADRIEQETARDENRTINLDPGYVSTDHVIVATGKRRAGRPYLGRGVYAYIALIYESGDFVSFRRTYPSYLLPETVTFFRGIRDDLLRDLDHPESKEKR